MQASHVLLLYAILLSMYVSIISCVCLQVHETDSDQSLFVLPIKPSKLNTPKDFSILPH